jgi:hypothetical protein
VTRRAQARELGCCVELNNVCARKALQCLVDGVRCSPTRRLEIVRRHGSARRSERAYELELLERIELRLQQLPRFVIEESQGHGATTQDRRVIRLIARKAVATRAKAARPPRFLQRNRCTLWLRPATYQPRPAGTSNLSFVLKRLPRPPSHQRHARPPGRAAGNDVATRSSRSCTIPDHRGRSRASRKQPRRRARRHAPGRTRGRSRPRRSGPGRADRRR